jgi:hypothetical protein
VTDDLDSILDSLPRSGRLLTGSPVLHRYRDAYRASAGVIGFGQAIKIAGAVVGGLIFLSSSSAGSGPFGGGLAVAAAFFAVIVGGFFWVCGVIVAAQGQILRATLDNAVATSHFLTDAERAEAMGLPGSITDRSGA